MSSKFEKEFNENLENGINAVINGLVKYGGIFFRGVFYGGKKLKNKHFLIGFLISFIIPILTRINNKLFFIDTKWYIKIIYFILLISPLIYLFIISKFKDKVDKYANDLKVGFETLNFVGLDGNYPIINYIKQDKESGFNEYSFQSLIPYETWEKRRKDIETVMNISIFEIKQGMDKQTVIIHAIAGNTEIKKMLEWQDDYIKEEGQITLGRNAIREIGFDLNKTPHVLAAGETGSGKSVILRCIFWQMLMQGADVIMIDFKGGLEFGKKYESVGEVVTKVDRAKEVFDWLVEENERRMKILRDLDCKNIKEYNATHKENQFKRIGVFIDEMAELMDSKGADKETVEILKQIEGKASTLARLSRATGINLILGLQRPDAKVLPGQIKNNIPVRICGRFADGPASEIVLNNTRATKLEDIKGRFLFKVGADTLEFQSYYFDDNKNFNIEKLKTGNKFVAEIANSNTAVNSERIEDNKKEVAKVEIKKDENIVKKEEVKKVKEIKSNNKVKKVKATNMLKNSDID
ncbi:FtsK/SpoIIIE domain-containing protein [Clostridium baratii]|uniref:FtsK/SpoIIIE domain-containing protein n=1 Tax=Clostridium baratii TaxID=1561 RepID=UPI0030D292D2